MNANSLLLNEGSITAETGQSGRKKNVNIDLQITDSLILQNESLISTQAFRYANGGNIEINTPLLTVFQPTGFNGSDIIANAQTGTGGNININSQDVIGITEGLAIPGNQRNDIDTSSQFGLSGQIVINSTIDPNRGVTQLPETVIDPNALIAQNACRRGSQSQFTRSGRGGLPPSISEDLNSEATQVNLVDPAPINSQQQQTIQPEDKIEISSGEKTPIVPTEGWVFNEQGEVELVAYNPTGSNKTQRLKDNSTDCSI